MLHSDPASEESGEEKKRRSDEHALDEERLWVVETEPTERGNQQERPRTEAVVRMDSRRQHSTIAPDAPAGT